MAVLPPTLADKQKRRANWISRGVYLEPPNTHQRRPEPPAVSHTRVVPSTSEDGVPSVTIRRRSRSRSRYGPVRLPEVATAEAANHAVAGIEQEDQLVSKGRNFQK
jgi:hypothetical protein